MPNNARRRFNAFRSREFDRDSNRYVSGPNGRPGQKIQIDTEDPDRPTSVAICSNTLNKLRLFKTVSLFHKVTLTAIIDANKRANASQTHSDATQSSSDMLDH